MRGPALAVVMLALLPSCGQFPGLPGSGATPASDAPAATAAAPSDIEAPDAFQLSAPGLWDGRPSLGGVWVAHPDVTEPERVRIVHAETGQEVVGALFRRERELPGPALQVSSDAAEALGMLAGAPAELRVVALRRQNDAPAPADAPTDPDVREDGAARTAQAAAAIVAGAALPPDEQLADELPASPLRYPFVQLAAGTDRDAAEAEAQALVARGLPARVAQGATGHWRVLLGPATTEVEQSDLQSRAVAEGYPEAYLVPR
jgi:hypothetical protein